MKTKVWISLGVILAVLLGTGIWAFQQREPDEVDEVRDIAQKMMDRENVTDDEREQLMGRMREIRETVPEEKRREVFRAMGQEFRKRINERSREFAALPEEQRADFLDQDIDRMMEMRERFRNREGGREGGRPGGGAGGRDGDRGGPGGDRRREWENMSDEERKARRRSRMDEVSAEDRAYMMEYFKAIKERAEERGIEMPGRGFGRRGGGPGRGPR